MLVAHVEAGRHLYGGARQVMHLIDTLPREGVRNVLLCPEGAEIAAALRGAGGADVVELPLRGDLDVGAPRRLRRALDALAPDLVHVHSRRGADLFGALASVGAPWPAVLTRRVDEREWPPWARLKYAPYAAIVAISRAVEAELVGHVALPAARVHLVPSGVDVQAVRPDPDARRRLAAALGVPDDALVAGVVGQLIPRKGHAALLDALPGVLRRQPRLSVLFFGRGPLQGRLRRLIERRGLDGRVVLCGYRPDLPRLLPGLDMLLHPPHAEGMGVAVLEAMSAGVPVAASAVGGLTDVIEDDASGLLVPPGDSGAWAAAIERLTADPLARRRLGRAGRRRVEDAFTVRRMAEGNLRVYRSVLGPAEPLEPERAAGRREP